MRIVVSVVLEMTLLDDVGNSVPDPTLGTPAHESAVGSARNAIRNAVKYGSGSESHGFDHHLSGTSSIMVCRTKAISFDEVVAERLF